MFLKKRTPKEVYCQFCGKNITEEGGDVSNDSKVYCHGNKPGGKCGRRGLVQEVINGDMRIRIFDYYNAKKIQKLITKGDLIHFGELEKGAQS